MVRVYGGADETVAFVLASAARPVTKCSAMAAAIMHSSHIDICASVHRCTPTFA